MFGTSWLTVRLTGAHLNPLLAWPDIAGIGVLTGTGFTVCLIFADLFYDNTPHLTQAKSAALLPSASASLVAALILSRRNTLHRRLRQQTAQPR
ncbi:Na+/H+ antiporter NhaA [Streptomyces sp. NPDC059687]|uniref:Na+/H+ antiporter NhaA n=1 Tax=unclassified Streptomyces TaxID=2593676 RepID=UPI0036AEF5B9